MLLKLIFFIIIILLINSINLNLNSSLFRRIIAVSLLYAGVLSYNTFYIQSIGSGVGVYSGLFEVILLSNFVLIFLTGISSILLQIWLNISQIYCNINRILIKKYINKQYILSLFIVTLIDEPESECNPSLSDSYTQINLANSSDSNDSELSEIISNSSENLNKNLLESERNPLDTYNDDARWQSLSERFDYRSEWDKFMDSHCESSSGLKSTRYVDCEEFNVLEIAPEEVNNKINLIQESYDSQLDGLTIFTSNNNIVVNSLTELGIDLCNWLNTMGINMDLHQFLAVVQNISASMDMPVSVVIILIITYIKLFWKHIFNEVGNLGSYNLISLEDNLLNIKNFLDSISQATIIDNSDDSYLYNSLFKLSLEDLIENKISNIPISVDYILNNITRVYDDNHYHISIDNVLSRLLGYQLIFTESNLNFKSLAFIASFKLLNWFFINYHLQETTGQDNDIFRNILNRLDDLINIQQYINEHTPQNKYIGWFLKPMLHVELDLSLDFKLSSLNSNMGYDYNLFISLKKLLYLMYVLELNDKYQLGLDLDLKDLGQVYTNFSQDLGLNLSSMEFLILMHPNLNNDLFEYFNSILSGVDTQWFNMLRQNPNDLNLSEIAELVFQEFSTGDLRLRVDNYSGGKFSPTFQEILKVVKNCSEEYNQAGSSNHPGALNYIPPVANNIAPNSNSQENFEDEKPNYEEHNSNSQDNFEDEEPNYEGKGKGKAL